jgi:hypothetical protein
MAYGKVTGADEDELAEMEKEHFSSPLYQNHGIPFEVADCLNAIGKPPEDYDGPQRYCKNRAVKKDDYDGHRFDKAAYGYFCPFHGGVGETGDASRLDNPLTAGITHGAYADDKHLIMDFTDEEQNLYDRIMEDWPEIYDWPDRSEDPARYRILRRVATNEVRSIREEEHLDEVGEIYEKPIYDDQGVQVGIEEVENPISREYRLLMSEVTDQMRELGLTPKERQKMDTLESQADKDDALTRVAGDALDGDEEYDPDQFDE